MSISLNAITRRCQFQVHSQCHIRHLSRRNVSASTRIRLAYELFSPPRGSAAGHISKGSTHETTADIVTASPILFLHGFLGSKRENRYISSLLARDLFRPVYAIDMRNHGDSGHHPQHNYMEMALDMKAFIEEHQLKSPSIIGHSMGAKTALTLALNSPGLVNDIVAVDNCPIHLPLEPDFRTYLEGLGRLRHERVTSHQEADKILKQYEKSPAIRLWLIGNLVKKSDMPYLDVRVPVETLIQAIGPLGDFPHKDNLGKKEFWGRALFLRALQSSYIPKNAVPMINSFFPCATIVNIDSGHWIVQERPEEFRRVVTRFLSSS
ncbi:Alpha/Beta hydrolase protein [Aspergillus crustosus]